jgi:hypothetical protein
LARAGRGSSQTRWGQIVHGGGGRPGRAVPRRGGGRRPDRDAGRIALRWLPAWPSDLVRRRVAEPAAEPGPSCGDPERRGLRWSGLAGRPMGRVGRWKEPPFGMHRIYTLAAANKAPLSRRSAAANGKREGCRQLSKARNTRRCSDVRNLSVAMGRSSGAVRVVRSALCFRGLLPRMQRGLR